MKRDLGASTSRNSHVENGSNQTALGVITKVLNFKCITSVQKSEGHAATAEKHATAKSPKSFCGLNDMYSLFVDMGITL